jgi:hypothetical protein
MAADSDTDAKSAYAGRPDAARHAAGRLRAFAEGAPIDDEAPELIQLADLAASHIVAASHNSYSPAQRAKLSDDLLAALTVLRFGPLLGGDPDAAAAARAKVLAVVELFEMAIELGSE